MDEKAQELIADVKNINRLDTTKQTFLMRKKTRDLLVVMEQLQTKLTHLQNRRDVYLADLAQWEKDVIDDVHRIMRQIQTESEISQFGVVSAINYEPGNMFCMIDGQIYYPSDKIDNVKIIDIQRYKVVFKKGRKSWTQSIGQSPNPAWTD